VFGLAERHGAGVDIHLHDSGSLGLFQIEEIAARTKALGMQGRVAVSHAYALGDIAANALASAADMLAESGVAIMTNAPGNHAFPPVAALRKAGVTVFSGSDNIRDSWWPYGDGDMLNRANMIGYRSGFYEDWELEAALDVVGQAGAKALGLEGYGIAVGASADFIAMRAEHVPEAVVAVPRERTVYRGGRVVAQGGKVLEQSPKSY
jgi:cytosine deaminase